MKATELLVGETYAYAAFRTGRRLPYCRPVIVLNTPQRGKVYVERTDTDVPDTFLASTRNIVSAWCDYEADKLAAEAREEEAFARRLEREEAYQAERAALLNLLSDHGAKADPCRIQKRYDGRAAVSLTLEEVRALIATRPLALHFPEADIPLPA